MFDEKELLNLFIEASKEMSKEENRCGNLVYTQKESGKQIIREPDVTVVFTNLLSDKGINFGVEVPTKERYKISGITPDSADIDLAINPDSEQINIEFKTRQPTLKAVEKDFIKFFGEEITGCAFFHILKNRDGKTLNILLNKYQEAYTKALELKMKSHQKWFLFFIYIKEKKEYYWQQFDDVINIPNDGFTLDNFKSGEV